MNEFILLVGKGKLVEEIDLYLNQQGMKTKTLDQAFPANEVIAVFDLEIGLNQEKRQLLQQVETRVTQQTPIFTSVLHRTATEIASWLFYPERLVGFSPLLMPEMTVVEVCFPIQSLRPNHKFLSIWKKLGKGVEIVGDQPGLVCARTLALLVNEASFALSEGVAKATDIDLAMEKGLNHPQGPLQWADRVGVHHLYAVLEGLQREYGEDRYRPAPLLRKMMYAQFIGVEAEQGFYRYGPQEMKRDSHCFADRSERRSKMLSDA
ncbi:3-hydroxybutyryl-CoA dehydrogenase [Thermoactinomyces sp. DSM 45891]|uniref:3-hydroxyacyl-CoA dehydrogenase family protein n=1 Tax=Thermoactinomyces sp. DSM 45891 TaxID=1761907 RepID=UPI000915CE5A|nr:3-hydroxyacyl-CoA dehydrogenase family protein [Thermoactinomyces sp. DSM 45891]SFX57761.1 3-hydroxybutyryl-CoA dehydrogenase [Thermoactinomyces sp. DSM 45891]